MPRTKPDRHALLTALADHVLKCGLNNASLRPLAAAAGTSDRMLIYHFGNKEALIVELLEFLASQMAVGLDAALPPERFESEDILISKIMGLMRSEEFQPYIRVWLDIVAAAAQSHTAHKEAGHAIILVFLDWLSIRHPEGESGAAKALTLIEGCLIMDAVGHASISDQACEATREKT